MNLGIYKETYFIGSMALAPRVLIIQNVQSLSWAVLKLYHAQRGEV